MAKKKNNKSKSKAQQKSQIEQKYFTYPESFEIKKYLLEQSNDETVCLTTNEYIMLCHAVAPRFRELGVIRIDVSYRWTGSEDDIKRFKHLIRRFIVDKKIYTEDEARGLNIFDLIGALTREVRREEDRLNSIWKDALHICYETGLEHQEHWQKRSEEFVSLIEQHEDSFRNGKTVNQAIMPYMEPKEGTLIEGFRLPIMPNDLPFMYYVLGWILEYIFIGKNVFISKDTKSRLSNLQKYENFIISEIESKKLEDFKDYWILIQSDIHKHFPNEQSETKKDEEQSSGGDKVKVEIDLCLFYEGPSKKLLNDLIGSPDGIVYNPEIHGNRQPERLKNRLRDNKGNDCEKLADNIKKRSRNIYIEKNIQIILIK